MERLFQILAVILAGIAAYFLWQGNHDGFFLTAVFGAVSFFLSIRFQVKERLKAREIEREQQWQREDEAAELLRSANASDELSADEKQKIADEQRTIL